MGKTILVLASMLLLPPLESARATVIRVPEDRVTIQAGILASVDGDTVLVADGRYFENINFRGRNIVVASRFIEDGEPAHIHATIIDGSQPEHADTASCVLIVSGENESARLEGFTLTQGTGTVWRDVHLNASYREGGGLLVEFSSPVIRYNIITDNEAVDVSGVVSAGGGGIRCGDSNPLIESNVIIGNRGRYGAGIVMNYATGTIRNNVISENAGGEDYGGSGIWTYEAGPTIIDNNTIVANISHGPGGGILVWATSAQARNNIIWANTSSLGGDQIHTTSASITVTYSDVHDGWEGEGNIDSHPLFDELNLYLSGASPCIDAGDPQGPEDPEHPQFPGNPLYPAMGTLRNDMGAYGGAPWPILSRFTGGRLQVEPDELVFDYVTPGFSDTLPLQIGNQGAGSLTIEGIDDVADPNHHITVSAVFPLVIQPFWETELSVIWSHVAESPPLIDTLWIHHDDDDDSVPNPYPLPVSHHRFAPVLSGTIVDDVSVSHGICWIDFDSDGMTDVFVTNGTEAGQNNLLFRGSASGFEQVLGDILVQDGSCSRGGTWGDVDNDGDPDIVVANGNGQDNLLYINLGNGSFHLDQESPVSSDGGHSDAAAWGDYDNDGFLDLFVTNTGDDDAEMNYLYHNIGDGDGTCIRIDEGPVVTDMEHSRGAVWGDYDNDGDPDLFVANEANENNSLYRNEGEGSFTKIESGDIVTNRGKSVGGCWGDCDNDGFLDLFVSNWSDQNNFLYLNDREGGFTRIRNGPVVNDNGWSMGCAFGDCDNDGDIDLFVANGGDDEATPDFLYVNDGTGSFLRSFEGDLTGDGGWSYGGAWADYDDDGDLDLLVAKWSETGAKNALYINTGTLNHWLKVRCQGVVSNASGIGAQISAHARIGGDTVIQRRDISGQDGYCGQNGLIAHFGLGEAAIVDSLVIWWPSGIMQTLIDIQADQTLSVIEEGLSSPGSPSLPIANRGTVLLSYPNPFSSTTVISMRNRMPVSVSMSIYDMHGRRIAELLDDATMLPGTHSIPWDGRSFQGTAVSAGTYLVLMTMGDRQSSRRIIRTP